MWGGVGGYQHIGSAARSCFHHAANSFFEMRPSRSWSRQFEGGEMARQ